MSLPAGVVETLWSASIVEAAQKRLPEVHVFAERLAVVVRKLALEEAANAASKISLSCAAAIRALKDA